MLTLNTIPIPHPNIVSRTVDQDAVLVLLEEGKLKVINEVGAAIWELVDGERSIRQIAAEICLQFDAAPRTAEADTLRFVNELAARGIVHFR